MCLYSVSPQRAKDKVTVIADVISTTSNKRGQKYCMYMAICLHVTFGSWLTTAHLWRQLKAQCPFFEEKCEMSTYRLKKRVTVRNTWVNVNVNKYIYNIG